jgi:cytoskeletal protein RodZ
MQQTYQCPLCRAPVAFGAKFCTNCGATLNWAAPQQIPQPPPVYQQPQQMYHSYVQQPPKPKKTSPRLIVSIALVVIVILVGGVLFAINISSQGTPSNTSPPTASPPSQSPPSTDNIQPAISGVAASPSETSCVITWVTDEPATSEVEYGTTTSYSSSTPLDENLVVSHTVSLLGLKSGTLTTLE